MFVNVLFPPSFWLISANFSTNALLSGKKSACCIGTISYKTLSSTLKKELEKDRLVVRKEYPQIPPKVEYSLSERGRSLIPVIDMMCHWGEQHRPEPPVP
ncbi:winged helix-turn-helix transcriptional regulator [Serratia marcescens]|uniref:winged helix-turn-helix transcriptional regulator n=1 Tax=Serratia marcescens TaxID=615 RepID=UPI001D023509|nr:helix-turn-helix domain-containing protein [Serratia marcescens]MDP8859186.1 helix-turn-helix domain-containing protein [Serratia marcescens]UTL87981.1 helix-turn-helix transcriptional regulator [Serratia marcescens]UYY69563.1 helix-turn-helix transcriptional regulator [Serratia marcescens]BEO13722.1 hypothetical protein SMQC17_17520 [Serratia marcescens]